MNSNNNTICIVHEEGYGGCNILGVFSTLHKAEYSKKKLKIYILTSTLLLLLLEYSYNRGKIG